MEITRHFTATTIIVYKQKALLHFHKKLSLWLPLGGHIDRDELPEEAALREVQEESGLKVTLYDPDERGDLGETRQLLRPMYLLLESINAFHQHIDFIYFAKATTLETKPQAGETNDLRWFTADEIQKLEGAPENTRVLSVQAIELLAEN